MNLTYHKLIPTDAEIEKVIQDPGLIGLSENNFLNMNADQRRLKIIGEYYYTIWKQLGYQAGEMLMMAHWGGEIKPNWFDHRMHLLQPANYVDYWTISSDLVLRSLPLNGRLLSLCSGDGFYESMFYSKRAGQIIAVDCNTQAITNAKTLYNLPNITWAERDILVGNFPSDYFDVVCIRGAIEHFSMENQLKIFELAKSALKPGGFFVGDTPANSGEKMHTDHENEWKDEAEMRELLSKVFSKIETFTFVSKDRTTLLWKCEKHGRTQ